MRLLSNPLILSLLSGLFTYCLQFYLHLFFSFFHCFNRGAFAISEEVIKRHLNIAVIGIPKVIWYSWYYMHVLLSSYATWVSTVCYASLLISDMVPLKSNVSLLSPINFHFCVTILVISSPTTH